MEVAQENLAQSLEIEAQKFRENVESFKTQYDETVAEMMKEYKTLEENVSQMKATNDAAIAAAKRAEELKDQQDYYRIQLSAADIHEIELLRSVEPYLRDKEPLNKVIYKYDKTHPEGYKQVPGELCYLITDDWRTEYYYRGLWEQTTFAKNPYAAELNAEWPKIWDAKKDNQGSSADGYPVYKGGYKDNLTIYDYDYWLDFIEGASGGETNLSQFNVNKIGRRTKIVTQKDVNCLFSENIPPYIYINADGDVSDERKQAEQIGNMEAIQVKPEIYQYLSVGGGQVSAFNTIKDLLVTHTQYANNVNLTTIPIYHLEPNTRITIEDEEIGVKGDYLIKSISLPLTVNGTSSISATKCIEKMI